MDVFTAVIAAENERQLPFLATTTILMEAVKAGAGRETAHAAIKEHALATAKALRSGEGDTDMLNRLAQDSRLGLSRSQLTRVLADAKRFVGAAPQQVDEFVRTVAAATRSVKGAAAYQPGRLI